jgi:hypothetical protein
VYIVAVALDVKDALTCAGVYDGYLCNTKADTPVNCGDAIDVPLILVCL